MEYDVKSGFTTCAQEVIEKELRKSVKCISFLTRMMLPSSDLPGTTYVVCAKTNAKVQKSRILLHLHM